MADDMKPHLELTVDKFTFRFPRELQYSEAGLWIRQECDLIRIGLSDFAQQRNGDIAFANPVPSGTVLEVGDEVASIETVKVNLSLPSPMQGTILEVNSALQEFPELISQDPYGKGWIAVVKPKDTDLSWRAVLDAEGYVAMVRVQAEWELKS